MYVSRDASPAWKVSKYKIAPCLTCRQSERRSRTAQNFAANAYHEGRKQYSRECRTEYKLLLESPDKNFRVHL